MFALNQPTPAAQQLCFMVVIPWSGLRLMAKLPNTAPTFLSGTTTFLHKSMKNHKKEIMSPESSICV